MREPLEKIEARQRTVRETAEQLREQITCLTEQLAAAERTLDRPQVTYETVLELVGEDGTPPAEPLPPGYREILALFEQNTGGLRAKDLCQARGTGTEPRHTEGTRAKLKRLVSRGILTEEEPGLFTLVPSAPTASDTGPSRPRTKARKTPTRNSSPSGRAGL